MLISGCKVTEIQQETPEAEPKQEPQTLDAVNNILAKAFGQMDETVCNQIENPNQRLTCTNKIILEKAYAQNDITLCNKITNEPDAKNCKIKFYAKKALDENNPELCNKLEDDASKESCKQLIS